MHQTLIETSTSQSKLLVSQNGIVPKKKIIMGLGNIHLYEGYEDPRRHWFVCTKLWDATKISDEDKHMAQFDASL
jgi:hypothetical protein